MTHPASRNSRTKQVVVGTRAGRTMYRLGVKGGSVYDIRMTYAAYIGVIGFVVEFLAWRNFGFSHAAFVNSVKIDFLFSSSLIAVIKGEHGYMLHTVEHDFNDAFLALVIAAMCITISIAISLSF